MANHTESDIIIPNNFYFDFFNAENKQRVFILFGSNFICMKCGLAQSCSPVIETEKNITLLKIIEFHVPNCEYY